MYTSSYEYFTNLQYKVRAQAEQLEAFKSGEKYVRMKEEYNKTVRYYECEICNLKRELSESHEETVNVRNIWNGIVEDLMKFYDGEKAEYCKAISKTQSELNVALEQIKILKKALIDEKSAKYEALTQVEDLQGKILLLTSQLNHNYENSSLPSSASIVHKKITNNRERSGKKPGAQSGHKAQPRKRHEPTKTVFLPAPEEYLNTFKYTPAGEMVKQAVGIKVAVETTEYITPVFIEKSTGHKVHASFPEGVVDDVNYDGTVKAFAFLLNSRCNVSIDNARMFISEITGGELSLSKGLICNLAKQFSKKTEKERQEIFDHMLQAPVMHVDNTNARVNGKNANVMICVTEYETLYMATEHKGHGGIKDSPIEKYLGTLIHDHDTTFYSYGMGHQECIIHVLRYLKDSMDNEKNLTWSTSMRLLLQEMIHYRNGLGDNDFDTSVVNDFESRYLEILEKAREEYEYEPPSKYYRDGYNLYKRMKKYKDAHLLFLHDSKVEPDNNVAERCARIYKRKQKQVMTMRSFDSFNYLCNALTMIQFLHQNGKNLYSCTSEYFGLLQPTS